MDAHGDFYEDDEPLDDILAARASSEPFVTGPPPSRGFTRFFDPFRSYAGVMLSERGDATNVLGDMRVHPC